MNQARRKFNGQIEQNCDSAANGHDCLQFVCLLKLAAVLRGKEGGSGGNTVKRLANRWLLTLDFTLYLCWVFLVVPERKASLRNVKVM